MVAHLLSFGKVLDLSIYDDSRNGGFISLSSMNGNSFKARKQKAAIYNFYEAWADLPEFQCFCSFQKQESERVRVMIRGV